MRYCLHRTTFATAVAVNHLLHLRQVFDLRTRSEEELYVLSGHSDSITGIDLSPDGEKLISNSMDQSVRIWDVRSFIPEGEDRCIGRVEGHAHNYEKNLLRCRWNRDGTLFAAGSADRTVYVWSANSQQLMYQLPGHGGSVNDACFSPKEQILCTASSDKTLFMGELG